MIVEGGSGTVQWDLKLNSRAESPGLATLSTADHRSTFLIWGEYRVAGNETVGSAAAWLLFSKLWVRIVWSHPVYPALTFRSVVLLTLQHSAQGVGYPRVSDQPDLLAVCRPLPVVWSVVGPYHGCSIVPARSWWWHQQLLSSSTWLRREKELSGCMSKVTGLPRALPWCGTASELRGCWLGTPETAAVWSAPSAAVLQTVICGHVSILSVLQGSLQQP